MATTICPKDVENALDPIPEAMKRVFKPEPVKEFFDTPNPKPGEWLAEHKEVPQRIPDYLVRVAENLPAPGHNSIYVVPLGSFPEGESPSLTQLREYIQLYFGENIAVTLLGQLDITAEKITKRINPYSKQPQLLVTDIIAVLKRIKPQDAFCVLGITMVDLYPKPEWNFVFGSASAKKHCGVFSFARYNPAFYGSKSSENSQGVLFKRSCRVCVHEIGHMFSISHCVFYECLMSGSNHLEESESKPGHLCPVDLRKLHLVCKFDPVVRYQKLLAFYKTYGELFSKEIEWISKMLAYIG